MSSTKQAGLAGALAALLLPGAFVLATPAALATQQPQPATTAGSGPPRSKAQVEHLERLQLEGTHRTKAQIEHDEQQLVPAPVTDDGPPTPTDTGLAVGVLAALGLAATTGGVIVVRRSRRGTPQGA